MTKCKFCNTDLKKQIIVKDFHCLVDCPKCKKYAIPVQLFTSDEIDKKILDIQKNKIKDYISKNQENDYCILNREIIKKIIKN